MVKALAEVERRATTVIKRRTGLPTYSLLDIALDHLTLARVGLVREAGQAAGRARPRAFLRALATL